MKLESDTFDRYARLTLKSLISKFFFFRRYLNKQIPHLSLIHSLLLKLKSSFRPSSQKSLNQKHKAASAKRNKRLVQQSQQKHKNAGNN